MVKVPLLELTLGQVQMSPRHLMLNLDLDCTSQLKMNLYEFLSFKCPKTVLYLYGGSKSKGICFCYGTSVKNLLQKCTSPVHQKGNLHRKLQTISPTSSYFLCKIVMPFPLFYKYEKQT